MSHFYQIVRLAAGNEHHIAFYAETDLEIALSRAHEVSAEYEADAVVFQCQLGAHRLRTLVYRSYFKHQETA